MAHRTRQPIAALLFALPAAVALLLTLVSAPSLHAQAPVPYPAMNLLKPSDPSLDASRQRAPLDLVHSKWLFRQGDDPHWSSPSLDDSHWQLVDSSQKFASYAQVARNRVYWYRLHLRFDGSQTDPALKIYSLARAYSAWANGNLLAQFGGRPGHPYPTYQPSRIYDLPAPPGLPADVVLAFRCVLLGNATTLDQPLLGPGKLTLGSHDELQQNRERDILRYDGPYWALLLLQILVGILTLMLFRAQPSQRDYLWIALLALQQVLQASLNTALDFVPISRDFVQLSQALLDAALTVLYLGFYAALMHHHLRRWKQFVYLGAFLIFAVELLHSETTLINDSLGAVLFILGWVPLILYPLVAMRRSGWRAHHEARLMLFPFALLALEFLLRYGSEVLVNLGLLQQMPAIFRGTFIAYFYVNSTLLANTLFWLAVPAIIVFRSNRLSRENARIAADMEAARRVQALLVPATPPATPGFLVDTVYIPAQEVGGDFFLVSPAPDYSLLIVVGDVSGKGVQAAMVVAAIVGILRNEASRQPETVLAHLNSALCGIISGFATCLCLHIDADGRLTVANAGHIPPYLDGRELALPGALPLGLAPGTQYDTLAFPLQPGNRIVLVSDGVVEAESGDKQLLGFEGTRRLSTQSAQAIAATAAAFGQNDDITVVAITWTGNPS